MDVAEVEIGKILHISDIKLPKGVESIALNYGEERDSPIFTVNKPKEEVEEVVVDEAGEQGSGEETKGSTSDDDKSD